MKAGEELGYPVVMKLLSPGAVHKAKMGGVVLDIGTTAELRRAFSRLEALSRGLEGAFIEGYLVQEQRTGGREIFLGGRRDPQFGPVVLLGMGGTSVERTGNVAAQLLPADPGDLEGLLGLVPGLSVLAEELDQQFIETCVRGLARLIETFPAIRDVDVNPVKVGNPGEGGCAVDVRIIVSREVLSS